MAYPYQIEEVKRQIAYIASVHPMNKRQKQELTPQGLENLKGWLQLRIKELQINGMTAPDENTAKASDWWAELMVAAYAIADNLSAPTRNPRELADLDDEFIKVLESHDYIKTLFDLVIAKVD